MKKNEQWFKSLKRDICFLLLLLLASTTSSAFFYEFNFDDNQLPSLNSNTVYQSYWSIPETNTVQVADGILSLNTYNTAEEKAYYDCSIEPIGRMSYILETRLRVNHISGERGALLFAVDGSAHAYHLSFVTNGLYIGCDDTPNEGGTFFLFDHSEYHTYTLRVHGGVYTLSLSIDDVNVAYGYTQLSSGDYALKFGDFVNDIGEVDVDIDYIRFFDPSADNDDDGIPNDYENSYSFLNPSDPSDASLDYDNDFMTNLQEYQNGCDPENPDSNYDGLPDGWQQIYGSNPLRSTNDYIPMPELIYEGCYSQSISSVSVDGNIAYVNDDDNGFTVLNVENKAMPHIMGTCNVDSPIDGPIAVSGHYSYIGLGNNGLQCVNVIDLEYPSIVGSNITSGIVYDFVIKSNFLYCTKGHDGLKIFDISNHENPTLAGSWNAVDAKGVDVYGDNYVVVTEGNGTLNVVNISNPQSPVRIGVSSNTAINYKYVHVNEPFAYVANDNYNMLSAFDLSIPTSPSIISFHSTSNLAIRLAAIEHYVCVADWYAGLTIVDTEKPYDASIIKNINLTAPGDASSRAEDICISGSYIYLACGSSGLQIYRIKLGDSDHDGLGDAWELDWYGDLSAHPTNDLDSDGLQDLYEFRAGLNPLNGDQDQDGLTDGDEVFVWNSDPRLKDSDGDGIDDFDEVNTLNGYQTRPDKSDTDDDGMNDWAELDLGRDPTDDSDGGFSASLCGTIYTSAGFIQTNSTVLLRGDSNYTYFQTHPDVNGLYCFEDLAGGQYYIKVSAPGFKDIWYVNGAHRTNAVAYVLPTGAQVGGLDFYLESGQNPSLVDVNSDPAGAQIYLDYQPISNTTPATIDVGEIIQDRASEMFMLAASHTITIQKPGYPIPAPQAAPAVEAETVTLDFNLIDQPVGSVMVETTPGIADVYLDYADTTFGVSPVMITNLIVGSHTLLLNKDGYKRPRPVIVHVQPEANVAVSVPLNAEGSGVDSMDVTIQSVPPMANVMLDYLPITNTTSCTLALDTASHAGLYWYSASHALLLNKDGYLNCTPRYIPTNDVSQVCIILIRDINASTYQQGYDLPDQWIESYEWDHLPPAAQDQRNGDDDADGDGVSNKDEMGAGTDPTDAFSVFEIFQEGVGAELKMRDGSSPEDGVFQLQFASVAGKQYIVQASSNLTDAQFITVSGVITATGDITIFEYQTASNTNVAFRVLVLP